MNDWMCVLPFLHENQGPFCPGWTISSSFGFEYINILQMHRKMNVYLSVNIEVYFVCLIFFFFFSYFMNSCGNPDVLDQKECVEQGGRVMHASFTEEECNSFGYGCQFCLFFPFSFKK